MDFVLPVVFTAIFFQVLYCVIKAGTREASLQLGSKSGQLVPRTLQMPIQVDCGCPLMRAEESVTRAYSARAAEYTGILGSMRAMHEADRRHVENWASQIDGPILDAGCGPGHWTDLLHRCGADVSGVDLVPEFIDGARARFPEVAFHVGSMRRLDLGDGTLAGVLAWYSLIHMPPDELTLVLAEFARVLMPRGQLLLGLFEGVSATPFQHAVTEAYCWSVDHMTGLLQEAGFAMTGVETRHDPGSRPHASISAVAA